jgi:hypothetical protein
VVPTLPVKSTDVWVPGIWKKPGGALVSDCVLSAAHPRSENVSAKAATALQKIDILPQSPAAQVKERDKRAVRAGQFTTGAREMGEVLKLLEKGLGCTLV